jgi:hypothetical protein
MVARSSSGEDGAPATDPITTSLAAKRQRKAALAGALHGRRVPQQQRDTAGRYTRTAAGLRWRCSPAGSAAAQPAGRAQQVARARDGKRAGELTRLVVGAGKG